MDPLPREHRASVGWALIRWALYAAILGLLVVAHMREVHAALGAGAQGGVPSAAADGVDRARALLGEDGALEWRQAGLLLVAMGVALIGMLRDRRPLDLVLALLLGAAVARELDDVLAALLGRNAHRPAMGLFLVGAVAAGVHFRRALVAELPGLMRRPAFWFAYFGAITMVALAQVLGQTPIWEALAADEASSRVAKRYVEEGLELVGYALVLLGVIEEIVFRPRGDGALSAP